MNYRSLITASTLVVSVAAAAAEEYYLRFEDERGVMINLSAATFDEKGNTTIEGFKDESAGKLYFMLEVQCENALIAVVGENTDFKDNWALYKQGGFKFLDPREVDVAYWRAAATTCRDETYDFPLVGAT